MEVTHDWKINKLDSSQVDGYISIVHWQLVSFANNSPNIKVSCYGSVFLERPDNLIRYNDLPESTVVQWVKTKLNESPTPWEELEKDHENQIKIKLTPQTVSSGLPWENFEENLE